MKNGINVLSCFDGLGGGITALKRAGIKVNKYYTFEIDAYAIKIALKNHPEIIWLGDINGWRDFVDMDTPDLIIGGSPCQGFSIAGKGLNFQDPRSKLFFVFVDILNYWKDKNPNLKFMLENVRMKKEWKNVITEYMGVEPIMINSALVSAQNRVRLYWTNIQGVTQPEDRGLILADILEDGATDREKSYAVDANYWKGGNPKSYFEKGRRQLVFGAAKRNQVTKRGVEAQLNIRKDKKSNCVVPTYTEKLNGVVIKTIPHGYVKEKEERTDKYPALCGQSPRSKHMIRVGDLYPSGGQAGRIYSPYGKSPTLYNPSTGGNQEPKVSIIDIREYSPKCQKQIRKNSKKKEEKSISLTKNGNLTGSGTTPIDLEDGIHYRKLTPVECERLQTLEDNYTEGVSNTQRYKMIGNGWTIEVISHIFSFLPKKFYTG